MKRLIAIILILLAIFGGMVIYKKIVIKNNNTVNLEDIEKIETYLKKIYMYKETTNEALPRFSNINEADETWIWEVVKNNLEEYELSSEQIEEKAKEIFGLNFTKQFPKEGTKNILYDNKVGKYIAEDEKLDEEEDCFLLNKIEKIKNEKENGYEVEIVEYLEDYSKMLSEQKNEIVIKNLNGEEITTIDSEKEEEAKERIKENLEKFTKKKVYLSTNQEGKIYIERVE